MPTLVPLAGTPGAEYLAGRGIQLEIAHAAGVRYAPRWEHWAKTGERWELEGVSRRVVFPLRDPAGALVGMQGRAIAAAEFGTPMLTRGHPSAGAFITPGALDGELLVIAEAPMDALSLFACGLPAVGTTGINTMPSWLVKLGVGRRVLVATDADPEGDRAAAEWAARFTWARQVERLRPTGAKDWNAMLQADPAALRTLCTAAAWDEAGVWERIVTAQRQARELVPEGGIGWAEDSRPALLAAIDAAEEAANTAHGQQDRVALDLALLDLVEAHRAVGTAFGGAVDTGAEVELDEAELLTLFSEG